MTTDELDKLAALEAAATPGPGSDGAVGVLALEANAALIVAMRNALPELLRLAREHDAAVADSDACLASAKELVFERDELNADLDVAEKAVDDLMTENDALQKRVTELEARCFRADELIGRRSQQLTQAACDLEPISIDRDRYLSALKAEAINKQLFDEATSRAID